MELFSKEALSSLEDHSERDEMPEVATPALKLLLSALVLLCVVAVFWCIFGTVNYMVNATAVVFPFGEARPVSVPYEGTVDRVMAVNGADVSVGDPLVRVRSQLATTVLTAPEAGVVLNAKSANSPFAQREPVAWLLPQHLQRREREVLAYVTFNDLRKIKIGSKVQVTPSDLKRESWGYAVGTVTGIEHYPTNRQAVGQRLKLPELASFVPADETVYEVRILLDQDADGLVWSRQKSKTMAVTTGMPCNVQIIWKKMYIWQVLMRQVDNTINTLQGN